MSLKHLPPVAQVNQFSKGTMMEYLGIEFLEYQDGNLRASMPVDHRTHQPMGLLHGGASAALAESLGSAASWLHIDHKTQYCVGIEVNANHLRSVRTGKVIGTCIPVHLGKSLHVWDIRIVDEADRLVCVSRLTVAIRQKAS